MKRRRFLSLLPAFSVAPAAFCAPPPPNFSGRWVQSNERCQPRRTGEVVRTIQLRGSDLVVETAATRASGPPRHATQRYNTDGHVTVSTGADGDEFHTSVVWKDGRLAFSVEEHEDGRILRSQETWTLLEGGNTLQIAREPRDAAAVGSGRQVLIFVRQDSEAPGR